MERPKRLSSIAHVLIALPLSGVLASCVFIASSTSPHQSNSSVPLSTFTPSAFPLQRPSATPLPLNERSLPDFVHIFVVVLENTSYHHIIGSSQAPYLNSLAQQYGLATQYYSITHLSLPNYLALTGGSTFGVTSNCALSTPSCPQRAENITDLIERSGRTWAAYFESMPTACTIDMQLPYTFHLNPFVYYTDIVTNPSRCKAHVIPYHQPQFLEALQTNTLPNYVWLGPNLLNNIHNGSISQADSWLSANIRPILISPAFENSLIILTFDEGDDGGPIDRSGCCGYSPGGGRVMTMLISPLVKKGFQSTTPETHYHLLRTIEDAWGLAHLGQTSKVAPMHEFFSASGSANVGSTGLMDTFSALDPVKAPHQARRPTGGC